MPLRVWLLFFAFCISAFFSYVCTPFIVKLARRWGALDVPSDRKIHKRKIPRIGGLSIYLSASVTAIFFYIFSPLARTLVAANFKFLISIFLASTLVMLLGLLDDVRGINVWQKFLVQFIAAIITIWGGLTVNKINIPFYGEADLGVYGYFILVLWLVGVTNAFNLIDGLDGLAGGVSFVSTMMVLIISLMRGEMSVSVIMATLGGAILGFMKYNFNPARIFLGDSGSLFLGYLMAVFAVKASQKGATALAIVIPVLIVAIPLTDTLFAMFRRFLKAFFMEKQRSPEALKAMFTADKQHIHHTLLSLGYTHRRAVIFLYSFSLLLGLFAILSAMIKNDIIGLLFLIFGGILYLIIRWMGVSWSLQLRSLISGESIKEEIEAIDDNKPSGK